MKIKEVKIISPKQWKNSPDLGSFPTSLCMSSGSLLDDVICGSGFQLRRNKGGPTSFVICPNTHLVSDQEKEQNMRGWGREKGSKIGKDKIGWQVDGKRHKLQAERKK